MSTNRQLLLAKRPEGLIRRDNFDLRETPVADPAEGEVRVRQIYLSLDPTNRIWMSDLPGYLPPVEIGAVMRGMGIGVVEASRHDRFAEGDLVAGMLGWQTHLVGEPKAHGLQALPKGLPVPLAAYLGVLGPAGGITAYFGLLEIGKPQEGETVVVSGAAGSVGSVAGQIAKIKGCRVVGIAGSDAKCSYVTDELGFDACVNYKAGPLGKSLREACPDGIDVDFENVGGAVLDAVLPLINLRARIVLCGLISQYNATAPPKGPAAFGMLLMQRARLEGFIILDYAKRYPEAFAQLAQWIGEGKLKHREHIVEGLESAPEAINRLFSGDKMGKLVVRVSPDP